MIYISLVSTPNILSRVSFLTIVNLCATKLNKLLLILVLLFIISLSNIKKR